MRRLERLGRTALIAAVLAPSLVAAAPRVRCHVDYGGETRSIEARPVASPLGVAPVEVGSYFRFRLVVLHLPSGPAGLPDEVRIETFSDRDDGPVLIHQARHDLPRRVGVFTGRQTVYEPMRDGELQYQCAMIDTR